MAFGFSNGRRRWIGFDLDGTLANDDGQAHDPNHIGDPILAMVAVLRRHLAEDHHDIKIMTARVGSNVPDAERATAIKCIQQWCKMNLGQVFEITCEKDFQMARLYDDRAVGIVKNTGMTELQIFKKRRDAAVVKEFMRKSRVISGA